MTTPETVAPKPTAKHLAEQALEDVAQLRTELTELREKIRDGVPITVSAESDPRVKQLDEEFSEFVEFANKQFSAMAAPPGTAAAIDPVPLQKMVRQELMHLEEKTAKSFAAYSKIVDSHNAATTAAISELREQMPSVADLVDRLGELTAKVELFDEAGVAPASAEEIADLNGRLKAIEQVANGNKLPPSVTVMTREGVTAATADDLNLTHQRINDLDRDVSKLRSYLDSPTFAAIERSADRQPGLASSVPAIYGQVHELMNLVTELGKDQQADQKMGGYKFRSIDAAMSAVGHALRQVGVMFQPREIVSQKIERYTTEQVFNNGDRKTLYWTHVWVTQRYAFVSLVDGTEMTGIEMDGEARDNGDKSTSKADSMRLKYALLQALMIPITGLPESDGQDGTEGGQTYGRGEAGESWENATPAPVQKQEKPYDPQAHAEAARQTPPEDTRTPEEKALAAYHRLVELAGIEKPEQRPRLNKILNGISTAGIGHVMIHLDGDRYVTLADYAATVNSQVGA